MVRLDSLNGLFGRELVHVLLCMVSRSLIYHHVLGIFQPTPDGSHQQFYEALPTDENSST